MATTFVDHISNQSPLAAAYQACAAHAERWEQWDSEDRKQPYYNPRNMYASENKRKLAAAFYNECSDCRSLTQVYYLRPRPQRPLMAKWWFNATKVVDCMNLDRRDTSFRHHGPSYNCLAQTPNCCYQAKWDAWIDSCREGLMSHPGRIPSEPVYEEYYELFSEIKYTRKIGYRALDERPAAQQQGAWNPAPAEYAVA